MALLGQGFDGKTDQMVTSAQARQRFHLTRHELYYQIERGRIRAQKVGGRLYIPLRELRAYTTSAPIFVAADGKRFRAMPGTAPYGTRKASRSVPIRLTPDERAAIERIAADNGISMSDFCRAALGDAIEDYDAGAGATLRRIGRKPENK